MNTCDEGLGNFLKEKYRSLRAVVKIWLTTLKKYLKKHFHFQSFYIFCIDLKTRIYLKPWLQRSFGETGCRAIPPIVIVKFGWTAVFSLSVPLIFAIHYTDLRVSGILSASTIPQFPEETLTGTDIPSIFHPSNISVAVIVDTLGIIIQHHSTMHKAGRKYYQSKVHVVKRKYWIQCIRFLYYKKHTSFFLEIIFHLEGMRCYSVTYMIRGL